MEKQFLWLRAPGLHYYAPGNINFSAGDSGSVSFWYHPSQLTEAVGATLWKLEVDDDNYAEICWSDLSSGDIEFSVFSAGIQYRVKIRFLHSAESLNWWLITATWDFTTPDGGELHLYVNDKSEVTALETANAPIGLPMQFYLGAKAGDPSRAACIDHFAIYDDVMSQGDHEARRGAADTHLGRRNARRRGAAVPGFDGTLLFHADFNGSVDAHVASGDATGSLDVGESEYDEFGLIDDGSRYLGRRLVLPLGLPAHDGRDDDRLPGASVLDTFVGPGIGDATSIHNDSDCTRIVISDAPSEDCGEGVGWLCPWFQEGELLGSTTVRLRVNMPDETNPTAYWTSLGPLAYYNGGMHGGIFGNWGTGMQAVVVEDPANTASTFKTTMSDSDEWIGAELSVITGNCAPARLRIADYDPSTQVVTVDGALPEVPGAGSMILADHRGRLCAFDADGVIETQNMEAWLWERFADDRPWEILECQRDEFGIVPVCRYDRGRTTYMDFTTSQPSPQAADGMMFGKNGSFGENVGYSAEIRLESIEIDGPGTYQLLAANESRYAKACAPRDTFMVKDPETDLSTRTWRAEGITHEVLQPTKFSDPAQAEADLAQPGTWRDSARLLSTVAPSTSADEVIGVVEGTDPGGVMRLGYCRGTFDGEQMTWQEEAPPAGRNNPFLAASDLRPRARSDADWGVDGVGHIEVFGQTDGTWSLKYTGAELNPDHYITRMLHGAPDRWSFSYEDQYWHKNPICPGLGGVDKIPPEWSGINLWGNRDSEYVILYDEYTDDPSERFRGYGRGKTILAESDVGENLRPLIGFRSPDLKTFFPLPHGNMVSPLPSLIVHGFRGYISGPETYCMLVEHLGGDLRLLTSEDGIHFQQMTSSFIPGDELPGEGRTINPSSSFRIGEHQIYYYVSDEIINYAYAKVNRETCCRLSAESTSGYLETSMIERPEDGWQNLRLNAHPKEGQIRVAVIDPSDETVVDGYGFEECDPIYEGTSHPMTWQGARLSELTHDYLRLRFRFERTDTADASPDLYGWEIAAPRVSNRPSASDPQVEQATNPANVTDAAPEFSWAYSDPGGLAQSGYHILVASDQALLDSNEGDLWDSGPMTSAEHSCEYAGDPLDELTTYVWKVRVRNSEGVWSEQW